MHLFPNCTEIYCVRTQSGRLLLTSRNKIAELILVLKASWRSIVALIAMALMLLPACAAFSAVSVDDIVGRTKIASFSIAPDGKYVAFLTVRARPRPNNYAIALLLEKMSEAGKAEKLAEYSLDSEHVYDAFSHQMYKTVSQYVWSTDSRLLLYTTHSKGGMELRRYDVDTARDRRVLGVHEGIQIEDQPVGKSGVRVTTYDHTDSPIEGNAPKDYALHMREGFRLNQPLRSPLMHRPVRSEEWRVRWNGKESKRIPGSEQLLYLGYPPQEHWDGHALRTESPYMLPALVDPHGGKTKVSPNSPEVLLVDINPDRSVVSIQHGNEVHKLIEENSILVQYYAENTDSSRATYMSQDGRVAVLLRSTNLVPDELVKLDLRTGQLTPLYSPNEGFRDKTRGIAVRPMSVTVLGSKVSGRLFLPPGDDSNKRYPLVFTTYLGAPGFNLSDEVPILALVDHGIAVFALHALDVIGPTGQNGDFDTELLRVEKPRRAMELLIAQLSKEGIVDSTRCAVSGLSYGAEISMYAYWKSDSFRTISSATAANDPATYWMRGVDMAYFFSDRGYPDPIEGGLANWKRISAALNARPSLPPLLWQSPEWERAFQMQAWVELRKAGAQVEWFEYPNEGHAFFIPSNIWWVNERNLDWFRFWLKNEEDQDPVRSKQYLHWREMKVKWEAARRDVDK